MKNIGLISPSKEAYSETFIQQHRNQLDGNVIFYFNGNIPTENDSEGILLNRTISLEYRLKKKLKIEKFTQLEFALLKSFKRQKIQVVVAEYGTTAVAIINVCEYLKLPLIPIFHGYDASIKEVIQNYKTGYKKLFKYSFKIVAVSSVIRKTLIDLGCQEKIIEVSPCAPNDSFFKIKPNFEKQLLIAVGRFVDKKAPYYTILAFNKVLNKFPNVKLIIAGDGILFNMCENLISYLKIQNNIELLGEITHENLVLLYTDAYAFVQHSIVASNGDSEGTPVAVLEASAASLPIVSTYHAGIPDIVIDGKTGYLVEEHDIEGMALKIISLLENKSKAIEMGEKGRELVKDNFSKEKHIGLLNAIIEQIDL